MRQHLTTKKILALTLATIFGIINPAKADYLGLNPQGMPVYTIDLDLPPRERFKETALVFKDIYFEIERLYLSKLDFISY